MNETHRTQDPRIVWERYVASWKAKSPAEKTALFEVCLSPECVYTDPLAQTKGWEELLAYMADYHRQVPGGFFETQAFFAHHGRSIARWNMLNAHGAVIGDGMSYGEYDDRGRLLTMTGFYETAR